MSWSLPDIALRRPITVLMMIITLIGLGMIAWSRTPIEFLPKMDFPFVYCIIPYPGATPSQVENEVAIPAEGEFRTISQLKRIYTTSSIGYCSVRLEFESSADMALATAEVRDRMDRLRLTLPSAVERMYVQRFSSDSLPIMFFSISTPGDYEQLSHLARTVLDSRIQRVDGVADVTVFGKNEREILVEFDQDKLRSHGVSIYQAVSTLRSSSLNTAVGELVDGGQTHYVRVLDEFEKPEQIADIVIGPNALRIRDVAQVNRRAREADGDYSIDGREGVAVMVRKESEANTVAVCRAVSQELDQLLKEPEFKDLDVFVIFDQSEIILSALKALMNAGKYGGGLALLVLFIFLRRVRPTLLVALAIPTSVVVAIVYMFFSGMTLNLVTMISLIVALGMLVDNSIVVIENIHRYNQLGLDPVESARRGAREVGMAITAATLTTLVVFAPIIFLESGEMATYMKQFGLPITVSLLASLGIALTVIPLAASHMQELRPDARHPLADRLAALGARMLGKWLWGMVCLVDRIHPLKWILDLHATCLGWAMRWRLAAMLLMIGIAAVTIMVPAQRVGRKGMPDADRREVDISLTFDQNLDKDHAAEVIEMLLERIDERREELGIKNVFSNYGSDGGEFYLFLVQEEDLAPGYKIPYTTEEVRDILWQTLPPQLPGVEVEFEVAQAGERDRRLAIRMRGEDAETLAKYAEELKEMLSQHVPDLQEIRTDQERAEEEIQVLVEEALADETGVNALTIAQTVSFALQGVRMPSLKEGAREVPVWAQFREEDRKSRENLENVAVLTNDSELVPLNRVVSLAKALSPTALHRINGKNVTTISAKTSAKHFNKVVADIRNVTERFDLPSGYDIDFGSNIRDFETDLRNFMTALLLSCILIYLVMGALFESYILPLSILWSIPMAFLGVYWIMYFTDTALDTVALIGMVLMTGIVVNNGIVIVDHINQLRKGGMERYDAIVQAGRDRFRPVMMTALTTILGCIPIAIGTGSESDVAFHSLGRALIGGLASGTLLTLLVIPLVYSFVDDVRIWMGRFLADLKGVRHGSGAGRREEVL